MTNPNPVTPKTDTPATQEIRSILVAAIDRDTTNEGLREVAVIAANAIYWRNRRIRELESTLAAERASRDQLHAKFGFVPAADDPKKCACAYCVKDFEAIADMCAEYECAIELDGGYKDQVRQLRASRLQADTDRFNAGIEAAHEQAEEK